MAYRKSLLHNLSAQLIVDQIPAYGLGLLFAVVMIESLGVPLPGETALVATAIYAGSTHEFSIVWVVVVAAGAAIFGGIVGYCVGRTVGIRLLARFGRYVHLTEARLKVGQYLFLRHGGKIVFFGRFVAFMRVFASLLAGANRMQLPHFLAMNALGGLACSAAAPTYSAKRSSGLPDLLACFCSWWQLDLSAPESSFFGITKKNSRNVLPQRFRSRCPSLATDTDMQGGRC
jgi:membrane protein DedA with SNARE-associated domain